MGLNKPMTSPAMLLLTDSQEEYKQNEHDYSS